MWRGVPFVLEDLSLVQFYIKKKNYQNFLLGYFKHLKINKIGLSKIFLFL